MLEMQRICFPMKKLALGIAAFVLIALSLSSCSTAEGFGKDMEKMGQGIQKVAQ